jgi:hypothetical protein
MDESTAGPAQATMEQSETECAAAAPAVADDAKGSTTGKEDSGGNSSGSDSDDDDDDPLLSIDPCKKRAPGPASQTTVVNT